MKKLLLPNKKWISTLSFFLFFLLGNSSYIKAQICNATYVITDQNILVSNLENRRAIIKVYDENLAPVFECSSLTDPCHDPLLIELNDCGTYYIQIQTFVNWRAKYCDIFEEVNIIGCGGTVVDCPTLNANIGDTCDDGDSDTKDDIVQADCSCAGVLNPPTYDCPTLSANIGDNCDDGDSDTRDDVVQADCSCAGVLNPPAYDCPTLNANIGDTCDDGNPRTLNDEVQTDCSCSGNVAPPTFDCPVIGANIGDTCDDGNAITTNDTVQADCSCAGSTATPTYDCPTLNADIGDFCDDGNALTSNDKVQADCSCSGTVAPPPTYDCPILMANIGDTCDDGNPNTVNDLAQADCSCIGTLLTEFNLAHWTFENCDPGMNYDELTADTYVPGGFNSVDASIFNNSGMHSCNPGPDLNTGNSNNAICHKIRPYCFWVNNSPDAYTFSITIDPEPGQALYISKLSFFEKAPDTYEWLTGDTGANNPPTKYGWRILRNGVEIGRQIDIPTSADWSFEEFDFSNLNIGAGDCTKATYTFELLGYCEKDNGADVSIWDIDEVQIYGFAATEEPFMVTRTAKDKSVECDGLGNYVEYENWLASNGGATINNPYNHNIVWTNNGDTAFETICGGDGFAKVTFTATDKCGRSVDSEATFSVFDTKPPAFGFVPSDVTIECDDPLPTQTVIAADICSYAEIKLVETIIPGDCANESTLTKNWTVTDECGNAVYATQIVTIEDNTPPLFTFVPADITISCDDPFPVNLPTYTDNCTARRDITIEYEESAIGGFCTGQYTATRRWTITDPCGNTTNASQAITVEDNDAPTLSGVPGAISQNCTDPLPMVPNVTATDNCDIDPQVDFNEFTIADNCGGGTVVRTWTASDDCGNTFSQSQEITLVDNTAPNITTPAQDAAFECNPFSNPTDLVSWLTSNGGAVAEDDCSTFGWSHDFAGVLTAVCGGTRTVDVTFTATDACGNSSATTATFEIVDNTPPDIMQGAISTTVECDGNGNTNNLNAWLGANGNALATDLCGSVSWSNNYDPNNFVAGCGNTGSVEVVFTATDQCGLTTQTTGTFEIVDNLNPFITATPSDIVFQCEEIGTATTAINAWLANAGGAIAGDFCGTPTWSNDYTSVPMTCSNNPITFTANDGCGNTATVQAQIIVQDNVPPFFTAIPTNVTIDCNEPIPTTSPTASDQCNGNAFIMALPDVVITGSCPQEMTIVRSWQASDICGNTRAASQTVTVISVPPVINVPAEDEIYLCFLAFSDATSTFNSWITNNGGAAASDPCGGIITWSTNPPNPTLNGDCTMSGNLIETDVTFIATNECGQQTTTDATFIICDNFQAPKPTIGISSGELVEIGNIASKGSDLINSFEAQLHNAVVELSWTNNTGHINDHFLIERSTDGMNFKSFGQYENLSDDDTPINYNQEDPLPNIGTNFYRLKVQFLDGTHLYSEIRKIHISDIEDFGLFPNPAQEEVFVSLKGYQDRKITIQMIDHLGKVTFEESVDGLQNLNHRISLNGMQNGFYTIWVFADKRRPIGKKLIVTRMY